MWGVELTPEEPIGQLQAYAGRVETAGFDHIFTSCHYNNRDPFQALGAIATATESITLGPGVANPYDTHPVALCSRVATLQEQSDGRAAFGIGAGDRSTLSMLGVSWEDPLKRVSDTVRAARSLFNGERVTMDRTFRAKDATLNYDLEDPSIPIFVGAQGPGMIRLGADLGDGLLINAAHPDDLAQIQTPIERGRSKRDEALGEPIVAAYASCSVAQDVSTARNAARPPVAFIVGSADEDLLMRHDIDVDRAAAIAEAIGGDSLSRAFQLVSPAMIDAFSITGTPQSVQNQLDELLEYVDGIVFGAPLGPEPGRAIELLGDVRRQIESEGAD